MKAVGDFLGHVIQLSFLFMGIGLFLFQCRNLSALYRSMADSLSTSNAIYESSVYEDAWKENVINQRVTREEILLVLMTQPKYDIEIQGVLYKAEEYAYQVTLLPKEPQTYQQIYVRDQTGNITKIIYK